MVENCFLELLIGICADTILVLMPVLPLYCIDVHLPRPDGSNDVPVNHAHVWSNAKTHIPPS
eukprot:4287055-Ditylum_brightwellii.AAC.1